MILYVNGDSHSVGHGIHHENGMTYEDANYRDIGEAPHPANIASSYGALVAGKIGADLVCQARSGGSVARVIRMTKQFVFQTRGNLFVLIGWPSFEREEWLHNGVWYQINAGGHDVLPSELQLRYKQWVDRWSEGYNYNQRQKEIHQQVVEFHQWLKHHNIKHLFFNCSQNFEDPTVDFGDNFVYPYVDNGVRSDYVNWLRRQGFKTDSWGHFGADGHQAWAELLVPYIQRITK